MILAALILAVHLQDVLRADLDPAVHPANDFFSYANGGWLKRNPIPASESSWGIGEVLELEMNERLRKIDEAAAQKHAPKGTPEQQVGDFWAAAMDEKAIEAAGIGPLKPELERIDSIATLADVLDVAFREHELGADALFSFGIGQDDKASDVEAVGVDQGGLGLPDRDFYFNKDPDVANIRKEYVAYIRQILSLSGAASADTDSAATDVMGFETSLAQVSRRLEDLRDPEKNYHRMSLDDMESRLTPSIHWRAELEGWHLKPSYVVVGQPEFLSGLQTLLGKTPIATLQNYLRFHLIAGYAEYLGSKAQAIDFHFRRQVLEGQKLPKPRWRRVLESETGPLGFVLGKVFVKSYFPEAQKRRYSKLIEAVRTAFAERIRRVDWMSPATKRKALQKLAAMRKKVGYPDKWKDYSTLEISRDSYCGNMMSAARWEFNDELKKFGKPVDRSEWEITPQTFNAYYNASNNEIVMPAASFEVPGVKDSDMDDATVYGNMGGSWIGHEMTHGFDDQGRKYDAKGNLSDWWTKQDAERFEKRAALMVKQFDAYEPLPGLHINGKACLGENIADYGGVLLGLDAFKKTAEYKSGHRIAGLTPLQRYFLGYALSWLSEQRPASLRRQLMSDVHAPAKWRVNGPLSNIPDFYRAFHVKPGQPMWRPPSARVHIW